MQGKGNTGLSRETVKATSRRYQKGGNSKVEILQDTSDCRKSAAGSSRRGRYRIAENLFRCAMVQRYIQTISPKTPSHMTSEDGHG